MVTPIWFDNDNMGEKVKNKLQYCGRDVKIYPLAKIVNPQVIKIGDYSMIDDFTFINGGRGIKVGRYVHIAGFSNIVGGGELIINDYVVIGYGTRIITGTDNYHGGKRMSTALPEDQRNVTRGSIVIEKDAFIGTNVVIHPNVTIGEGSIIGSNSLVTKDVKPWSINVGSPCKRIGVRSKLTVEDI
jgi:galactoside O-acetyltransferase